MYEFVLKDEELLHFFRLKFENFVKKILCMHNFFKNTMRA
jgi:hypothetical protein